MNSNNKLMYTVVGQYRALYRLDRRFIRLANVLCVITLLFTSGWTVRCATLTAASTSATDVQAAINSASAGDTVIVPSGSATWSSTVTITKGITLVGGGNTGGTTTITQGGGANTAMLSVSPNTGASVTVKNFTFVESYNDNPTSSFIQWRSQPNSFWRCCSNIITCIGGMSVFGSDVGTGLIDNNNFTFAQNDCVSIFGTGDGTSAWNYGTTYGTTNYVFFEHNIVNSTDTSVYLPDGVIDCYGGAKFVFRYNIITNAGWGWHGCDSGGYRSTHSYEIYENTVVYNGANPPYWAYVFNSRGGTGLVWSNTVIGWLAGSQGHSAFLMQYYREDILRAIWSVS